MGVINPKCAKYMNGTSKAEHSGGENKTSFYRFIPLYGPPIVYGKLMGMAEVDGGADTGHADQLVAI